MGSLHHPAPCFEPRLSLDGLGFLFALLDMSNVASGLHGFLRRLSFVSGISAEMFLAQRRTGHHHPIKSGFQQLDIMAVGSGDDE